METPTKGMPPSMGFAGTPPRGAAAAAPPPVREEYQPRTIDPELLTSELLEIYLEPREEEHIKKEFIGLYVNNNLKPEYATPDILLRAFKSFRLIYGAILKKLSPGRIYYIELLKQMLNPAIHPIYDAKIEKLKSEGKIGGRRRNRSNRHKRTNRNRKSRRQARTRKN
jgi:hypothetical protein